MATFQRYFMLLSIKIERKVKGKIVVKLESAYLLWYMLAVGRMTFRCLYRAVYRHYYSYFYHFLLQFPFLRVCFLFMVESFVVVFFFFPCIFVLLFPLFFYCGVCVFVHSQCSFHLASAFSHCIFRMHFENCHTCVYVLHIEYLSVGRKWYSTTFSPFLNCVLLSCLLLNWIVCELKAKYDLRILMNRYAFRTTATIFIRSFGARGCICSMTAQCCMNN